MHPEVLPALITPFGPDGAIDHDAVVHNVGLLMDHGITGFLVAGSNGEGPYLEPGEREALCRSVDAAAPQAFLLCGIAAESVRLALAQIAEAAAGGADAALVMTPTTLVRDRHRLVAGFFTAVADRSEIPVFVYSVPRVTGYTLPVETALAVSGHPNVTGAKDSGGHPGATAALVAGAPPGFTVYAGASGVLALSVAAGSRGGITSSANYAPRLVAEVVAAARSSLGEAAAPQRRLTALAAAVEAHGVVGVKTAAARLGLRVGVPRLPLRPLDESAATSVRAAVDAADAGEGPD